MGGVKQELHGGKSHKKVPTQESITGWRQGGWWYGYHAGFFSRFLLHHKIRFPYLFTVFSFDGEILLGGHDSHGRFHGKAAWRRLPTVAVPSVPVISYET